VFTRRQVAEAAPVLITGNDLQHDFSETLHGLGSGFPEGVCDSGSLRLRKLSLEITPLRRQVQQTLPPIVRAPLLKDEFLPNQLTENTAQALLRDAQNCEQLADGHLWMASDEVNNAVMSPAKTVSRENCVRLGREITVGKKQQLDPLPDLLLGNGGRIGQQIYVRHVDISRNL
jgi:hypothetical protein